MAWIGANASRRPVLIRFSLRYGTTIGNREYGIVRLRQKWSCQCYTPHRMSGRVLQIFLRGLDAATQVLPWNRRARHLRTGRRGEDDAYFWLRRRGYVIVGRNWRSARRRGEIDLIGWEDGVLCFIEVKTRRTSGLVTAEAAIDMRKQRELRAMAADYMRRLPEPPPYRFDVVTVHYDPGPKPAITLLRNAFIAR
jgi:putative endonuclease